LGCFLVKECKGRAKRLKIVETEAYKGFSDQASHASRGKTERNAVMFGPAGYLYVYLVYGIHYMLNIVTERQGLPAAVLIRAGEVSEDKDKRVAAGPGKLARFLGVDRQDKGLPIFQKAGGVYVAKGDAIPGSQIIKTTRVGVDYAGSCKHRKWRYYIRGNPAISHK